MMKRIFKKRTKSIEAPVSTPEKNRNEGDKKATLDHDNEPAKKGKGEPILHDGRSKTEEPSRKEPRTSGPSKPDKTIYKIPKIAKNLVESSCSQENNKKNSEKSELNKSNSKSIPTISNASASTKTVLPSDKSRNVSPLNLPQAKPEEKVRKPEIRINLERVPTTEVRKTKTDGVKSSKSLKDSGSKIIDGVATTSSRSGKSDRAKSDETSGSKTQPESVILPSLSRDLSPTLDPPNRDPENEPSRMTTEVEKSSDKDNNAVHQSLFDDKTPNNDALIETDDNVAHNDATDSDSEPELVVDETATEKDIDDENRCQPYKTFSLPFLANKLECFPLRAFTAWPSLKTWSLMCKI